MSDEACCDEESTQSSANPNLIIAIGASAGGLKEIVKIVEQLPESFQGTLLIATHRTPGHQNILAEIIQRHARVEVIEPEDDEHLQCTKIYVGSPNDRVEVDGRQTDVKVATSDYARIHRIDDLFFSVAASSKHNAVGVILSGLLKDGVAGLEAIHQAGGKCIVQKPEEAAFDSMPINALKAVDVDFVGTTDEIASLLVEIATGRSCQ